MGVPDFIVCEIGPEDWFQTKSFDKAFKTYKITKEKRLCLQQGDDWVDLNFHGKVKLSGMHQRYVATFVDGELQHILLDNTPLQNLD